MEILDYGPRFTYCNESFNEQPNGSSSLWFNIYGLNALSNIAVRLDGKILKTSRNGDLITSFVPNNLLSSEKNILIEVFDEKNPDEIIREILEVRNKQISNYSLFQRKPNFFLIGSPRSGTTSLYWRLLEHPNVYMSRVKEPFFFDNRAKGILTDVIDSEEEYASLFSYAHESAEIIGEASTSYLGSSSALRKIHKFNKNARILVVLRNPIVASISFYLMHLKGGKYENNTSFEGAWDDGLNKNRSFISNYSEVYNIGDQLENAISIFGDKLKVIFFDDIETNSEKVIKDIFSFLELPIDHEGFLDKKNSAEWESINSVVSEPFLLELKNYFLPQIKKVSELTGRNLEHWMEV